MAKHIDLPLARASLDRDALNRKNPELFDHLWQNPLTRILVLFEGKTLMLENTHAPEPGFLPALRLLDVEQVPSAQLRAYLGKTIASENGVAQHSPVVLAVLGKNSADQLEPDETKWHSLRASGFGLSDRDAGLFTQALALANWHESHTHCPRCGMPTTVQDGGWSRKCFSDDTQVFPRTDPAIIVSVIDQHDRILLGTQGAWEENRYSILAGFVEPGESLAHAVIREVFEESGIRVEHPEYISSQAWPFPASLMVGFTARTVAELGDQELVPDGEEISHLRWYSREEITNDIAAGKLKLPGRLSISRALIENWFGSEIQDLPEVKA